MPTEADPIIGTWYEHTDKGQKFEVVSLDEDNGIIGIQYFDGDLDEIELDTWYEMDIVTSEAPEDWTGPVDEVPKDDAAAPGTAMADEEWSEVGRENQRSRRVALSDEVEEEDDELEDDRSLEEPWEDER